MSLANFWIEGRYGGESGIRTQSSQQLLLFQQPTTNY